MPHLTHQSGAVWGLSEVLLQVVTRVSTALEHDDRAMHGASQLCVTPWKLICSAGTRTLSWVLWLADYLLSVACLCLCDAVPSSKASLKNAQMGQSTKQNRQPQDDHGEAM